ncbi:hypothetical protein [Treponema endosymbiont of Eucomonympha sp.]|uniref:hypothetical protein n=1 Tax=Treponema endosymbiont of Eucomonympha sp. TaxID=1580831 RepID=UPI000A87606A|nr:hypothetical protein [Treponema endosymbiont of Eucomonympha sp.]
MAHIFSQKSDININPALPPGTKVRIAYSPQPLMLGGLTLPVIISTASAYLKTPGFNKSFAPSPTVMALFDTGASTTAIDIGLAKHLKLLPTGVSPNFTAAGLITMPTFAIDLLFRGGINPHRDLQIGSCKLNFNIAGNLNDPGNFGVLIGRDIMSRWNIVWNGPTSTVVIND